MAYPTDLNPTLKTDWANNTPVENTHPDEHNNVALDVTALKAKVGANGSAVTTSHDYKLGEVISTDRAVGKSATQTLTNKTLTSPTITNKSSTGTDSGVETLENKTLTSPTITTPTISGTGFTNAQHAHTGASSGGQLTESALNLTDNTTNNVTIARHGFVPKAPNSTSQYLRGDGTWASIGNTGKFGGTGADGALTISSGTTNIDLGGTQVFVRNYTSISITGTGALTFTNPHANGTIIILKSQGNVTLTSSATPNIDVRAIGAVGVTTRGGTSGRGGGALYIECAGALNFTGTINANGQDGTQSTNQNGANAGGGKGSVMILYNTLTSAAGTISVNNGASSAQQTGSFSTLGNGTDGTSSIGFFTAITGGRGGNTGTSGTSTVFNPTVYSQYSKSIQVVPGSSGGSGGLTGGPTYHDGQVGNGLGINIVALNTEFQ